MALKKIAKFHPVDEDQFYDPSKKEQRELLTVVDEALRTRGIKSGYMVGGSLQPTLEVSIPRGKNRRGGTNYTTFNITCI